MLAAITDSTALMPLLFPFPSNVLQIIFGGITDCGFCKIEISEKTRIATIGHPTIVILVDVASEKKNFFQSFFYSHKLSYHIYYITEMTRKRKHIRFHSFALITFFSIVIILCVLPIFF